MTLVEFLLARIAEDEADARAAGAGGYSRNGVTPPGGPTVWTTRPHRWWAEEEGGGWAIGDGPSPDEADSCVTCNDSGGNELDEMHVRHMVRWDPYRVVAECEAKLRIVGAHDVAHECPRDGDSSGWWPDEGEPCDVLRLLAAPYADHPDYRQEWRP